MKTLFTLIFLLCASIAQAQTRQVLWDMTDVASVATATAMTYKLYVTPSGGTTATYTLTGISCNSTSPTSASCIAPLPSAASNALLTGTRSELTATDSGVESPRSAPFLKPAAAPTNLRLTLLDTLKLLTRPVKGSMATLSHSIVRGLKYSNTITFKAIATR